MNSSVSTKVRDQVNDLVKKQTSYLAIGPVIYQVFDEIYVQMNTQLKFDNSKQEM